MVVREGVYDIICGMIDFGNLKGEYTVLAYLVEYAERARDVLRRAAVGESTFTDDACRAAFLALMRETTDDDALLLGVAQRNIPMLKDSAATEAASPDEAADNAASPGEEAPAEGSGETGTGGGEADGGSGKADDGSGESDPGDGEAADAPDIPLGEEEPPPRRHDRKKKSTGQLRLPGMGFITGLRKDKKK